jgi:hypothetical protein
VAAAGPQAAGRAGHLPLPLLLPLPWQPLLLPAAPPRRQLALLKLRLLLLLLLLLAHPHPYHQRWQWLLQLQPPLLRPPRRLHHSQHPWLGASPRLPPLLRMLLQGALMLRWAAAPPPTGRPPPHLLSSWHTSDS